MKKYLILFIIVLWSVHITAQVTRTARGKSQSTTYQVDNNVDGVVTVIRTGSTIGIKQSVFDLVGYYDNLRDAITDISSTEVTLRITSTDTVTANLTIPANVELEFSKSGMLSVASGDTIFLARRLGEKFRRQIFTGAGFVEFTVPATITPEAFGAAGDGSTEDSLAVRKALNSLNNGGVLDFGEGTFPIGLEINASNVDSNIVVQGQFGATTLKINADVAQMFHFYQKNNITIQNLTIDSNHGNLTAPQDRAFYFEGCNNVRIQNCYFVGGEHLTGTAYPIYLDDVDVFFFTNNHSYHEESYWVGMVDVDNAVISGNIFVGDGTNDTGGVFNILSGCSNIIVNGNVGQFGGGPLVYADGPTTSADPERIIASNNIGDQMYGDVLLFEQATWVIANGNLIYGNHPVEGGDTGISLGGPYSMATSNLVFGKQNNGIALFFKNDLVNRPSQSAYYKMADGNMLIDNNMSNPGGAVRAQIWLQNEERNLVSDNLISTISSTATTWTNYSIQSTGTSDFNLITNNYVMRDSLKPSIDLAGSNSVDFGNMRMQTLGTIDSITISAPTGKLYISDVTMNGDIDFNDFGGSKVTFWFADTNLTASQTDILMQSITFEELGAEFTFNNGYYPGIGGSIIGIVCQTSAAVSAGTLTITAFKESTDTGFDLAMTSGTLGTTSQAKDTDTFTSAQRIFAKWSTDGLFAPDGSMDIQVGIIVEY